MTKSDVRAAGVRFVYHESVITDRIGRHEVLSSINHKNYNFREKKNSQVMKERENILNYNFECDWLIELSDKKLSNDKLSDNNLASELVENRSFLNQLQSRKL